MFVLGEGNSQRLFQHTFGTHPEQPLPTGCKGIPFILGERGIAEQGVLYGCVAIFLDILMITRLLNKLA